MDSPRWADYRTSTDYPALYTALAAGLRIPCFVRDGDADRLCDIRMYGDQIQAGSRGLTVLYLPGTEHDAFASECQKINLRWLVPDGYPAPAAEEPDTSVHSKNRQNIVRHVQSARAAINAAFARLHADLEDALSPGGRTRLQYSAHVAQFGLEWCLQEVSPPGYIHEDELPEDITDADYSAWFDLSFVPGGFGCRVGPWPLPGSSTVTENETKPEGETDHGNL